MAKFFTLRNPDFGGVSAKEWQIPVPDEGQLFRSGGNYYKLQGGELYNLDPQMALGEKIFGSVEKAKAPSGVRTNSNLELYLQQQGITNQGQMEAFLNKELGIDVSKIPEYNFGDVSTYIREQYNPNIAWDRRGNMPVAKSLSFSDFMKDYGAGGIAGIPGQAIERDLPASEAPPLITGEGGPKTATGELIKPNDYTKYGITDYKIPPTTASQTQNFWQGTTSVSPYGEYVPKSDYLKLYTENEIMRDPSGRIYLKPNVPVRWQVPTTATPGATATQGTLIPSPDYLKYYTENEIERGPDGRIYLKKGVPARWTQGGETTTSAEGKETAQNAVDDMVNFDMELKGMGANIAEGTPFESIMQKYNDALAKIMAPQTSAQNAILSELLNRPKMADELEKIEEEQGIEGVQNRITELNETAIPIEQALKDLPDNIVKRYQDIGLNSAQVARRLALESKDLSETLGNISSQMTVLQNDLSMRRDAVDRILKATELDREDRMTALNTGLEMIKDNISQQKELMDLQLDLTVKDIERKQSIQDAIDEENRKLDQKLLEEPTMAEKYGTGIIGEYNYYVEQETTAGRKPMTFNEYQTMDANRKRSVSNTYVSTPESYDKVLGILNSSKGSDGFVNTDVYKQQRNAVKDKATFDKNYSWMLNPNDPSAKDFFMSRELKTEEREP